MDIEVLLEQVRENMLTNGTVMPAIQLELTRSTTMIFLDIINDHQSIPVQCGILARYAWELCKEHPDETPVAISFCSEAWKDAGRSDPKRLIRPVNSPNKQEVLVVERWQATEEPKLASYTMRVVRDHKKRITQILSPLESIAAISYQLDSFVHGALDAQRPDEEVFARLAKGLKQRTQKLSPEQMKELHDFIEKEGFPSDILDL
jgi:hypothetical protein